MNIHPVGAQLFHAGGQTDMTKLIVTFCNFANTPKNIEKIEGLSFMCTHRNTGHTQHKKQDMIIK
jgi:hypothetical protein